MARTGSPADSSAERRASRHQNHAGATSARRNPAARRFRRQSTPSPASEADTAATHHVRQPDEQRVHPAMLRPPTRERDARCLDGVAERRDEPQVGEERSSGRGTECSRREAARHARPDQREETECPPAPCERPERRTDREDGRVAGAAASLPPPRCPRGRSAPRSSATSASHAATMPQEDGRMSGAGGWLSSTCSGARANPAARGGRPPPREAARHRIDERDRQRREADVERASDEPSASRSAPWPLLAGAGWPLPSQVPTVECPARRSTSTVDARSRRAASPLRGARWRAGGSASRRRGSCSRGSPSRADGRSTVPEATIAMSRRPPARSERLGGRHAGGLIYHTGDAVAS
jgi:hypothetical protein